jgi:NitT/TauT family transport system permease protein
MAARSRPLTPVGRAHRRPGALILGAIGLGGLVLAWEGAVRLGGIDPVVFASPGRVGEALARQWRSGQLAQDLLTSTLEFGLAYLFALLLGGAVGLLMGLARDAEYALEPFVWFLYSAPLVAFQPLLIVWVGFGFWSVIALAAALAAFPITINAHAGVRSTDPALLRAVRAFGGRRRDEILKVILPASVPLVLAGLRIGAGRALVGIVAGEMFGANAGLGFRLGFYGARLRAADVLVQVLGIVVMGLSVTQALRVAERRFGLGRVR